MMTSTKTRTMPLLAGGAATLLLLTGCGSDGYEGVLTNPSDDIVIGVDKVYADDVTVTCEGRKNHKTVTVETADGWKGVTEQPKGGEGSTGATVIDPDGNEFELPAGGDDSVTWTEDDQFTMTFEIDQEMNGRELTYYVSGASCAQ